MYTLNHFFLYVLFTLVNKYLLLYLILTFGPPRHCQQAGL
uniref:Uncharacterized protein n=1 Tax=Anguilla anguilla TaxID=7936 RepID=A0A0E9S068_ANGAN